MSNDDTRQPEAALPAERRAGLFGPFFGKEDAAVDGKDAI